MRTDTLKNLAVGKKVIIVDDEVDTLDACNQILRKSGYTVETFNDPVKALERLREQSFDLMISDLKIPRMDGIELLKEVKRLDPEIAVVIITGYASIETAVESIKEGAYDYIPKPFTPDELRLVVRKALENQELLRENRDLRERLAKSGEENALIGESEGLGQVKRLIEKVAETDSTVLIYGETGTGKELVAREIHRQSKRKESPMITINCAAIPRELLESELFGHEKGAFTGALRRKKGSFELADGGTLFLDEIGDMSLELQVKLMRALQEREIKPVGSERKMTVDVRILAATNRDLKSAMDRGDFREDLFYRLNVMQINIPPLRERKEDVPLLSRHFLDKYRRKFNKSIKGLVPEALAAMTNYRWPGNVRELENAIERAMILEEGELLHMGSLFNPADVGAGFKPAATKESQSSVPRQSDPAQFPSLDKVERDYILQVLEATRWDKKKASEILGISTVTIWRKTKESSEDK